MIEMYLSISLVEDPGILADVTCGDSRVGKMFIIPFRFMKGRTFFKMAIMSVGFRQIIYNKDAWVIDR